MRKHATSHPRTHAECKLHSSHTPHAKKYLCETHPPLECRSHRRALCLSGAALGPRDATRARPAARAAARAAACAAARWRWTGRHIAPGQPAYHVAAIELAQLHKILGVERCSDGYRGGKRIGGTRLACRQLARVVVATDAEKGAGVSGAARPNVEHRVVGSEAAGGEGQRAAERGAVANVQTVDEARARDEAAVARGAGA